MRLVAISDVHEQWAELELPEGDILIVAGDLCEHSDQSFASADAWFATVALRFEHAIYVPGNHDVGVLTQPRKYQSLAPHLYDSLLVDETIDLAGLRIHGMPWESAGRDHSEQSIPEGLDVLVTHEPPFNILDWSWKAKDIRLGNADLRKRIEVVKPRLHVFGHCHAAFGTERRGATTFANVAVCGDPKKYYGAYHPPTIIEIGEESIGITQWR